MWAWSGGIDVNVICCSTCGTWTVWRTVGAAALSASSAWFAARTQDPAWSKVTVDPTIVQAELLVAPSTENVTGLADAPPTAVRV
jgi:hypothetical protein